MASVRGLSLILRLLLPEPRLDRAMHERRNRLEPGFAGSGEHRPQDREPHAGFQFSSWAEPQMGEAIGAVRSHAHGWAGKGPPDPAVLRFYGPQLLRAYGLGPGDGPSPSPDPEILGPGGTHRGFLR